MESAAFLASQLLCTLLLTLLTYLRICSAFFPLTHVVFAVVFRCLAWRLVLSRLFKKNGNLYHLFFVLTSALAVSLPIMWSVVIRVTVLELFVPLTGRMGTVVPPDLIIGSLAAVLGPLSLPEAVSAFLCQGHVYTVSSLA